MITDMFQLVFLPGSYDPSKGLPCGPVCWLEVGMYHRDDHPKIRHIPLLSPDIMSPQELEWWGEIAKKQIDKTVRQGKRKFQQDYDRRRAAAGDRKGG